eukprot:Phypoly_transcript_20251.p1 GENE.Phypoly_transcript_20251~~Phypoly_transcript_20251.p1  ORF type:complete len:201 (+),score=9.70 Phypoly_transcript_20251:39-641(+)
MRTLLIVFAILCSITVVYAQYLVATEFVDENCSGTIVRYDVTLMSECLVKSYANTSMLLKQDGTNSVTLYEYLDTDCAASVNSSSFALGKCVPLPNGGYSASISYSVSQSTSINLKGPALQMVQYATCSSTNPYAWYTYNPDFCIVGKQTSSISMATCNATTYTLRQWDSTTECSGKFSDIVTPLLSCDELAVAYSCYGV